MSGSVVFIYSRDVFLCLVEESFEFSIFVCWFRGDPIFGGVEGVQGHLLVWLFFFRIMEVILPFHGADELRDALYFFQRVLF